MKRVCLVALGSRGDVQPMAVLAGALTKSGVPAAVIALREYAPMIASLGGEPVPIDAELASVTSRTHRGWERLVIRSVAGQGVILQRWAAEIAPQVTSAVDQAVGAGDTVLVGVLTRDLGTALATDRGARPATLIYAGQVPTLQPESHYFHRWFTGWQPYNRFGTRLNWQIASTLGLPAARHFRVRHGLRRLRARAATRAADAFPTLLAASPLIVPPAADWPASLHQTGYLAPPRQPHLPEPELVDFLAAGDAPVYVGFGSMAGTLGFDPARPADIRLLIDAARLAKRRIITPTTDGIKPGLVDDRVLAVAPTPHSWLLPRMAGVIHHGGAGTTHAALLAGVPSMATPFGVDQPYHAHRLHALGLGPAPIPVTRLSAKRLAGVISQLTSGDYNARAAELGEQARAHDGVAETIAALDRLGLLGE